MIVGAIFLCVGAGILFLRLGQEFVPTLDEKDTVKEVRRIPSTSLGQWVCCTDVPNFPWRNERDRRQAIDTSANEK